MATTNIILTDLNPMLTLHRRENIPRLALHAKGLSLYRVIAFSHVGKGLAAGFNVYDLTGLTLLLIPY